MDAPVAVSAVSGEAMAKLGITELHQLNAKVPGLQMGWAAAVPIVNIRGIGSGINKGFEQSVGLYIDGIYQSRSNQFTLAQFDLQQVEVLRGPQGTLFGKNTVAGAIKVETTNPVVGDDLGGSLSIDYEPEYDTQRYTGIVSGSVVDTLAARLAVRDSSSDGYIENLRFNQDVAETDDQVARLTLIWNPTGNFTVTPKFSYIDSDRIGTTAVNPLFDPTLTLANSATVLPVLGSLPLLTGEVDGLPFSPSNDTSAIGNYGLHPDIKDTDRQTIELLNSSVKVDWEVNDYTFTSLSAYVDYDKLRRADGSTSPVTVGQNHEPETLEMFSQELRLSSSFDGPLNFIAGIYYEEQDLDNTFRTTLDFTLGGLAPETVAFLSDLSQAAGGPALPAVQSSVLELLGLPIDNLTLLNDFEQETETLALFTELSFELTDTLTLDIGLRYSEDEKDTYRRLRIANGHPFDLRVQVTPDMLVADAERPNPADPASSAAAEAAIAANVENILTIRGAEAANTYAVAAALGNHPAENDAIRTEYHLDPAVRLRWQYGEDGLAYLSYSEGYKSGGFNQSSDTTTIGGNLTTGHEFNDETVEAWELGIKQSFMKERGRFSAILYRTELSDQQVTSFQGISFIVTNAAKLIAQGIELEAQYLLTENLEIGGSLAYLDNEYEAYPGAPCDSREGTFEGCLTEDFKGKRAPFAPEYSGTVYATYTYNFEKWEVTATISANYKDEMSLNPDLNPNSLQDAYTKIDARVGLDSTNDAWAFQIYGRNLTDETTHTYFLDAPLGSGLTAAYVEEPRIIGLQATYNF